MPPVRTVGGNGSVRKTSSTAPRRRPESSASSSASSANRPTARYVHDDCPRREQRQTRSVEQCRVGLASRRRQHHHVGRGQLGVQASGPTTRRNPGGSPSSGGAGFRCTGTPGPRSAAAHRRSRCRRPRSPARGTRQFPRRPCASRERLLIPLLRGLLPDGDVEPAQEVQHTRQHRVGHAFAVDAGAVRERIRARAGSA